MTPYHPQGYERLMTGDSILRWRLWNFLIPGGFILLGCLMMALIRVDGELVPSLWHHDQLNSSAYIWVWFIMSLWFVICLL